MQNVLAKISRLGSASTGRGLNSEDIILCQRRLLLNQMPSIPADYLTLLHRFNSLCCNGSCLYGISPRREPDLDILYENALIDHPGRTHTLILGQDELEYLAWDDAAGQYQTIDKDSFEVLNTYTACENALLEFLKLSNDNQHL